MTREITCPQCLSITTIDPRSSTGFCMYCGTKLKFEFKVEPAPSDDYKTRYELAHKFIDQMAREYSELNPYVSDLCNEMANELESRENYKALKVIESIPENKGHRFTRGRLGGFNVLHDSLSGEIEYQQNSNERQYEWQVANDLNYD